MIERRAESVTESAWIAGLEGPSPFGRASIASRGPTWKSARGPGGPPYNVQLEDDADCKTEAGISAIVQVVPVVIADVHVVGSVPVIRPAFRPRVEEHEPITAVLESRIPGHDHGSALHTEPVLAAKRKLESVLRNVVATIAAALRPSAMLGLPVLGTILLPGAMLLPTALPHPSALLLPHTRLLLGALLGGGGVVSWLLLLLLALDDLRLLLHGPRLLWLLLGALLLLLLGGPILLLLLLGALLLLLLSGLGLLLLLLGVLLLLCGLGLLFLFVLLGTDRSSSCEKQEQHCRGSFDRWNTFHVGHLPPNREHFIGHRAGLKSALRRQSVFRSFGGFSLGLGLVHRSIRVVGRRVDRVEL